MTALGIHDIVRVSLDDEPRARRSTRARRSRSGPTGGATVISRDASRAFAPGATPRSRRRKIRRSPMPAGPARAPRRRQPRPHPRFRRRLHRRFPALAPTPRKLKRSVGMPVSCSARATVVTTLLSMVPPNKGCGWHRPPHSWLRDAPVLDNRLQRRLPGPNRRAAQAPQYDRLIRCRRDPCRTPSVAPGGMTPPAPLSP